MKADNRIDRRDFIQGSMALLGASSLRPAARSSEVGAAPVGSEKRADTLEASGSNLKMRAKFEAAQTVWILLSPGAGFQERLGGRELARGLRNLGLAKEPINGEMGKGEPGRQDLVFSLRVAKEAFKNPEAYEITQKRQPGKASEVLFTGATPQAVLYAVFDFLERQGAFFGLDGEVYPLEPARALTVPPAGKPWQAQPRFGTRGLVPWPDFLNCVTVYNREDWRAYLEAMLRMRFNTLGVHVYSGINQWAEPFLSFEYGGVGHLAFTDTSATHRWGNLPQRTSRYGMGGADFYGGEVFGTEAATQARDCFEAQERAQQLWREAFRYAQQLGIRVGVGFEPYKIPDEIFRALPPEAQTVTPRDSRFPARLDLESVAARDIMETRLGQLLEAYPTVDYVWLWEDEGMSGASRRGLVKLSVTPFTQAHDFLKRHAPGKRLVVSGWGGVSYHFGEFHKALPEDIIFSSLSDNMGWDPVSEEYGRLEGRERWAIPWLEDDAAMWLPQFHVNRFAMDMDRAETFGCQGLMGIHWRQRIMDANAGYQARYSWDKALQPAEYFRAYARALARPAVSEKLAVLLNETDRDRRILCSWMGEMRNGRRRIRAYTGDYSEGFQFWSGYEPDQQVKDSQAQVAQALHTLTDGATSPGEREHLNYLAGHVDFLVRYTEAWSLAWRIQQVLNHAADLKKAGKMEEARAKVATEGIPLWLKFAPLVREAILSFQEIVSTRNDLGTLASIHNKFERLALYRLRGSMKEFLGELPPETEKLLEEVRRANSDAAPRVFIPTRCTLLRPGDSVHLFAIATGPGKVADVTLLSRWAPTESWSEAPMKLVGRKTFVAELKAPKTTAPLLDYYVRAHLRHPERAVRVTAPLEAPAKFYTATIV